MVISVLLVDDDLNILDTASDVLDAEGFQVFTASSGAEAKQRLQKHAVHIAILDFNMRDTTGAVLARELRQLLPTIKIILMTGEQGLDLGTARNEINMVLTKPVDPPALAAAIHQLVEN